VNTGQHVTINDHVATVLLDRPPVNALTTELVAGLGEVFAALQADDQVRVVVIAGSGKAFSAGFDIKELLAAQPSDAVPRNTRLLQVFGAIEQGPLPVIAAIEGYALGGGCELALACDVRVAARDARLALPEIKLGGLPGIGGMQRLQRLIGQGKAKQLVLTGEQVSAVEAYRIGLIDELAEPGHALQVASDIAATIAARAPVSVRAGKRAINLGSDLPLAQALELDLRFIAEVAATEDRAECLRAYVEKREPKVIGR
jgi:enoyl-CoA hydratase